MNLCTLDPLPYQPDPAAYFERVREAPGAILLDSGRPVAQRGRYDLISAWPLETLSPLPDENAAAFFVRLRLALARLGPAQLPAGVELPFAGGLIGLLAYDFGRRVEVLPAQAVDDLGARDAQLGLYSWAVTTDHATQRSYLVCHPRLAADERRRLLALFGDKANTPDAAASFELSEPFRADLTAERYRAAIERIQQYIRDGDCYQVNFAQRFQASYHGQPWQAYRALRQACPTPFAGFLSFEQGAIASLSPERFLSVVDGQVETRPIKGTRRRMPEPGADAAAAAELLAADKDRAENLMIVDLLRNDLGRSCRTGSVRVPELFALESYPNVHHLVSAVRGELAAGKDALDLLAGSFPGGSITGAPKIRAMQIIDELEPTRRSIYCGSLLYLDVRGRMDSSIAIRTLLFSKQRVYCWGGGGIVADSNWQAEYQESLDKVNILLRTLEAAGR
ncbi:aminodeoxychorismate synthase component I [Stutzerimonas balearica]|uniref:aminodeoxychorismate synthase component I n=1 Tax=Stutzerimonas balearica TaxID=74829 RepID=UPI0028986D67|nr:aminodeoxychorismate synthase component I [Stutzerimonas balearica]